MEYNNVPYAPRPVIMSSNSTGNSDIGSESGPYIHSQSQTQSVHNGGDYAYTGARGPIITGSGMNNVMLQPPYSQYIPPPAATQSVYTNQGIGPHITGSSYSTNPVGPPQTAPNQASIYPPPPPPMAPVASNYSTRNQHSVYTNYNTTATTSVLPATVSLPPPPAVLPPPAVSAPQKSHFHLQSPPAIDTTARHYHHGGGLPRTPSLDEYHDESSSVSSMATPIGTPVSPGTFNYDSVVGRSLSRTGHQDVSTGHGYGHNDGSPRAGQVPQHQVQKTTIARHSSFTAIDTEISGDGGALETVNRLGSQYMPPPLVQQPQLQNQSQPPVGQYNASGGATADSFGKYNNRVGAGSSSLLPPPPPLYGYSASGGDAVPPNAATPIPLAQPNYRPANSYPQAPTSSPGRKERDKFVSYSGPPASHSSAQGFSGDASVRGGVSSGSASDEKPRIDPSKVPRPPPPPKDFIYHTRAGTARKVPPVSNAIFQCIDTGNSSPRFLRVTTGAPPASSSLASKLSIPMAIIATPFARPENGEEPVPLATIGDNGLMNPVRCSKCKGYVNPYVKWISDGHKWICNLCQMHNDTPTW